MPAPRASKKENKLAEFFETQADAGDESDDDGFICSDGEVEEAVQGGAVQLGKRVREAQEEESKIQPRKKVLDLQKMQEKYARLD
jgi:hypothetical protein